MLRVLSLFYCWWIGGSHLKSDNDSAVIRQTKEDKICMFRGYEHVQRAHSFRRKKLPCDPALASAGLCVGVTSDIDTIFGPSEAMLFGSNLSKWARPVGAALDPVSAACALCHSGEHPSEIVLSACPDFCLQWATGSLWKGAREHTCRTDAQETRHFEKWGRVPTSLCVWFAQEERAEADLYLQYLLLWASLQVWQMGPAWRKTNEK